MKLRLRTKVKIVAAMLVLLIAGLPLATAATVKNLQAAQILWLVGAAVFLFLTGYFVWTLMLTRVELLEDTLIVTSPGSTRRFTLPDDIKKVVEDAEGIRDVYLENAAGRYVLLEGKYLLPGDSKLAVTLAELERQVKAS